jgi:penicillin-insensitive murein endopeptidase
MMETRTLQLQPKDSRRYFMLPQAPEDAGYYVYGTPGNGAFQYAHPTMMTAILLVEREWQTVDNRRFGVGNISLADGISNKDHATHRSGLEVDVRPLRKDGQEIPVYWSQKNEYDKDATAMLINMFLTFASVKLIYFNGPDIPFVTPLADHDNHFHVWLRG